jgi:hypothetical protein
MLPGGAFFDGSGSRLRAGPDLPGDPPNPNLFPQ